MNNHFPLHQLEYSRNNILRHVASLKEEEAKRIPDGFKNSILWNVGHILLTIEDNLFKGTGRDFGLPDSYPSLFARGTQPAQWVVVPPSLQELIVQVKEQTERVKQTFNGNLEEKLPAPVQLPGVPPILTVAEMLNISLLHECQHLGYIMAMKHSL